MLFGGMALVAGEKCPVCCDSESDEKRVRFVTKSVPRCLVELAQFVAIRTVRLWERTQLDE
jgi:hypothetical protein